MIQLDAPDPLRTPLLSVAARTGNINAVSKLLKDGRRADNVDNRGWTALHEAAAAGHVECAVLLLSHDGDIKDLRTYEGETPLFLSVNPESKLVVMKILLNHSANVNLGNNEEFTPLHKEWCLPVEPMGNTCDVLRQQKEPVIIEACELDSLECAQLLLEYGADINAADADGNRPIHEAINKRSVEMVNLLLRYEADLKVKNSDGLTPLMRAAYIGFNEIIEKLDKPELHIVNERASSGRTALMMATQAGCLQTTRILLEMGADANIVCGDTTALHMAAHGDDPRLVECLIPVTDLKIVAACSSISPIMLAVDSMQVKSIELLLEWMKDNPYMLQKFIECESETLGLEYRATGAISYLLYHKSELPEALAVLILLLQYGLPVNVSYAFEAPPLVAIATSSAPKEVKRLFVQILLDHGADADHPVPWRQRTPVPAALYYACLINPDEKWLIRLLMSACRKCDPDTLLSAIYDAELEEGHQRSSKPALQNMLDVVLELGFSNSVIMSQIWRKCRRSGLTGESQQNLEEETSENYLSVPEVLAPSSLSKLCRIVIRRHYCLSSLEKYELPKVINDFLNYVF
ncbi:ankyrin repeat and SOCS box protein 2-like isoform X2 [Schistocerca nitens]|uniref:ankyrin repeat and SOCS box protein 2-like isoform X2 n=1 Tax=Schistocerca nitens TaxID=7011 RepID=UPI002117BC54|nr:ankyrin repeat and SOCS box protein 2-like isoform X2 [Schistocerca nitens]